MNGPREQRLEQFARFPVRLLAAVRPERLGLLAVLILRCHQGRNYLRHQAEFALADLSRDLGWENENTSRTECNAARQMLRRWMYDFHDKSLIQVTVGEGREARWTVRLTGALVQNADVTFVSRSDGPPMSGSAMPAIARPEPDYALGPEPECHVPDQAESHVPVTFGEPDCSGSPMSHSALALTRTPTRVQRPQPKPSVTFP